ncbi:MAG TPA: hypothetical protein EYQ76_01275 [Candidatus Marinimicrobia bacterium]|jgi:hypothetical protein|nr:hypothetical protein [Candidatus Neomarinimicrobiota bacterium]
MNKIEKFVLGAVTICIGSLVFMMNETKEVILTSTTLEPEIVMAEVSENIPEDTTIPSEAIELALDVIQYIDESDMIVDVWDENRMLAKSGAISFQEAFKNARKELGPDATFEWYGRKYTTNYYYEINQVIGEQVFVENSNGELKLEEAESLAGLSKIVTYRDNEEVKVSYEHLFPDAIAAAKDNGTYDDSKIMSNRETDTVLK